MRPVYRLDKSTLPRHVVHERERKRKKDEERLLFKANTGLFIGRGLIIIYVTNILESGTHVCEKLEAHKTLRVSMSLIALLFNAFISLYYTVLVLLSIFIFYFIFLFELFLIELEASI